MKSLDGSVPTMTVYQTFRSSSHTNVFSNACAAALLGVSIDQFAHWVLDWSSQRGALRIREQMQIAKVPSIRKFGLLTKIAPKSIRHMLSGDMEYAQLRTYRYIAGALKLQLAELLGELFNSEQLKHLEHLRKIAHVPEDSTKLYINKIMYLSA